MSSKKNEDKIVEGSTAHERVPPDQSLDAGGAGDGGPMPMGMAGKVPPDAMNPDPDQKSTHVKPKTVQGVLPDGSPKFMDPEAAPETKRLKAGKYRVVGPGSVSVPVYDGQGNVVSTKILRPGEETELDAEDATSLGPNVEPIK
jgi:hypothetical protein